jgi:MSHA biogenesis protein MshQ
VTLSDAVVLGVGSWSNNTVPATAFSRGVASSALPSYAFTDKLTGAKTLTVRAVDPDNASSSGYTEGSTGLRSGRLRLANAVGSHLAALQLQVLAEYWSGNAWVANGADSCTVVPASAVVKSNQRDGKGNATSAWSSTPSGISLSAGAGLLSLSAPTPSSASATGTLDLALNLGSSSTDASCNASHPASTGAGLAWLRSRNGSCASTYDRDPAARATFGVYSPETRKTVHVREIF